jgi:hypothetical protein
MEAGQAADGDAERPGETRDERRKRKKSRWGAETEAGRRILESAHQHAPSSGGGAGAAPSADAAAAAALLPPGPVPGAPVDPAPKRRRSRWEPQEAAAPPLPAAVPGQIVLPDAIAQLISLHSDPKVLELQSQLKSVSAWDMIHPTLFRACGALRPSGAVGLDCLACGVAARMRLATPRPSSLHAAPTSGRGRPTLLPPHPPGDRRWSRSWRS